MSSTSTTSSVHWAIRAWADFDGITASPSRVSNRKPCTRVLRPQTCPDGCVMCSSRGRWRRAGEEDDPGIGLRVVVVETGVVDASAAHQLTQANGLCLRLGGVGIGHLEADVEHALAVGVE